MVGTLIAQAAPLGWPDAFAFVGMLACIAAIMIAMLYFVSKL